MRFGKENKGKLTSSVISQISDGTVIDGDIDCGEELLVNGTVKGNICCSKKLVIGTTGRVYGNIRCEDICISGSLEGDINCQNLLILESQSVVCVFDRSLYRG